CERVTDPSRDNVGCEPRASCGVRSGIGDLAFAEPPARKENSGLQGFRPRMTTHADNRHPIRGQLDNFCFRNVGDHVWSQIRRGIVHFIKQLFFHGPCIHDATGPISLRDDEPSIAFNLRTRKSTRGEIRHVLESWISKVSASYLRSALEQMPGY